ncbi:TPA: hypothetical protein R2318_000189 [Legionella pneumophila]|nr:hypothetical protein [Legionella pneumophila]HAT8333763.1 hypothetical protein [Legionella pneumophila]HAU2316455.1 hypothetical protein [Legionella pneumophila]HCJ1049171.1 hypothetical protein [Legionella pneumophila]HEC4725070.1 hypothetical protein [Legionella pneumophila]
MNITYTTKYKLEDIVKKIPPDKIFKDLHDEINRYVINRLPYPDITQENYDPLIVVEHLFNIRKLIEDKSKQISNIFSYYEWIYHIRRLPDIFFSGRLETTYPYDISLALYVASFSKKKILTLRDLIIKK